MTGSFKVAAAAALVALLPFSANAVTIIGNIDDPIQTAGSGADGPTYNLTAGPYSAAVQFFGTDGAGELEFEFLNDTGAPLKVALVASVNQLAGFFTGGIDGSWPLGNTHNTGQGDSETYKLLATLNPGVTKLVLFNYGNPVSNGLTGIGPALTVQIISAVPLPASILMLLGALGGLGYIGFTGRRRAVTTT